MGRMEVKITRSNKRVKTVSARAVNGVLEVSAPAHISDAELLPIIEKLKNRLGKREKRKTLSDQDLEQLAAHMNQKYFQGKLTWNSISWSTRQNKRYGSCTPSDRTIRISHQLEKLPKFVLEYVVMHELAHLLEGNHGPPFWKLVNRYPYTERARGYLMAVGLEEGEE
jgi:predicted metal-dependent hydrolase